MLHLIGCLPSGVREYVCVCGGVWGGVISFVILKFLPQQEICYTSDKAPRCAIM